MNGIVGPMALGPRSRVLVFGTESATDAKLYREIVGRTPEQVSGSLTGGRE